MLLLLLLLCVPVSADGCSLVLKPSRVVVGFGESVSVSCEATRPVRVLGWESSISAVHTQQDLAVQWKADSLIDWIEEPICYGVFFTAPRQCEEKLNLVLYSALTLILKICPFASFVCHTFTRSFLKNTQHPPMTDFLSCQQRAAETSYFFARGSKQGANINVDLEFWF